MRVGYAQFEPVFGESDANLERIACLLRDTSADLLVFPELAISGYYFKDRGESAQYAETVGASPALDRIGGVCAEQRRYAVVGFAEQADDELYNSAALIGPDGLMAVYRKIHLFNTEKACFDAGNEPPPVMATPLGCLGLMICYDWRFPEMARSLALRGAQVICHPSNLVIPDRCQDAMQVRCMENHVFAVTCNRHGEDDRPQGTIAFTGGSQIVGPTGRLLHRGPQNEDEVFTTTIDPRQADDKTVTPRNHAFEDRRPECYGTV